MTAARTLEPISVEDYLAGELRAKVRHEYVAGYVYAMAGGTNTHSRICIALTSSLHAQLRGQACEATNSDVKVRIRRKTYSSFYYPDAMVVCDPNSPEEVYHDRPVVIAEVLSDSTRRIDEGEKRDAYFEIDSLAVYLLIEQRKPLVTVYRRGDAGFGGEVYEGLDAVVPLPEVGVELPLAELYERVDFSVVEDDADDVA